MSTLRSNRPIDAREFAVAAHGDQRYGDRPYVEHLAAVVDVLEEFGFSDEYVAAGWLHDVVEDTDVTEADIQAAFGEQVAKLVSAVSGGGNRETHVASIYEKIEAYPDAAFLKLADRIANVEACARGDKHSIRYAREHPRFATVVGPHVPPAMWERYLVALKAKSRRGPRHLCPSCGQKAGVSILYGYPTEDSFERAERNEIALGGCSQLIGAPNRQCLDCGHQWLVGRRKSQLATGA